MKIQVLILATSALCNAAAVVRAPRKQTFQLFPHEKAKADAESAGVFQPESDHTTTVGNHTNGKTAVDFNSGVAAAGTCVSPTIHPEWRDMSDDDKNSFIGAKNVSWSRYEDLVSVHQQMTGTIHMVGQFLPWHRYYLSIFESFLRDECLYASPMPWWDEAKDAADFSASPLFTEQWFGPALLAGDNGAAICLATGFPITLHIGPGEGLTDRCLGRALDLSLTANCDTDFTNYCNSYGTYAEMEPCAEGGTHAYGHDGIGGAMSDVASSPGDPVFFMHHSFVDHNWRIWQNADPARLTEVGGNTLPNGSGPALDLDYVLTSKRLRDDVTVRDVMDVQGGYLRYQYDY